MSILSPVFLSVFLPLCLGGGWLCRRFLSAAAMKRWLLVCSAAFLLLSGGVSCMPTLGICLAACLLPRWGRRFAQAMAMLAVAALVALKALPVAWPVGFSFVALQAASYAMDVARGACVPGSAGDVLLYLGFFPKLAAGPICRFGDFRESAARAALRPAEVEAGLMRFIFGLGKKLLLADRLLPMATAGFQAGAHPLACALALVACPMYVYYDFSGYADMALGVAQALGIALPENFRKPFAARSLRDFWRRWHITLSAFMRDYVYIPLGGSRVSARRTTLNVLAVFLLTGLWHGLTVPYALFGLWHGLWVALEHRGALRLDVHPRLARCYALAAVALGFVIFMAPDAAALARWATGLMTWNTGFAAWQQAAASLTPLNLAALLAAVLGQAVRRPAASLGWKRLAALMLLAVCFAHLMAAGYAPFLYAGF